MTGHLAAIGLGSNLGDRALHLRSAVAALGEIGSILAVSSLYETDPIGGPEGQDPYLNAVAIVVTDLEPAELLDEMMKIERSAGRIRGERFAPRTLDLDLLLFDHRSVDGDDLTVPHPRMTERRFVLEPLLEVLPAAALPDGTPLDGLLADVADQRVVILPDRVWAEAEPPPAAPGPRRRGASVVPRGCARRMTTVLVVAALAAAVVVPRLPRASSQ